jgi:hypothetical protein
MEHVVFYPTAEDVPAFRRVSSLDEAINFVEHLRNVENVSDFSVFELAPVELSMRAYYHVQVPAAAAEGTADAAAESVDEPAPTADVDVDAEPVAETAAAVEEPAPVEEPAVAEEPAPVEEPAAVDTEPLTEPAPEWSEAPAAVAEVAPEAADASPVEVTEPAVEASDDAVVDTEPTMAPVEADDDRSAEWVAEAVVVEAPVEESPAAAVPEVIGLAADEPVLAVVPPFADPVVAAEGQADEAAQASADEAAAAAEPSEPADAPQGPFADAPPVTAAVPAEEPLAASAEAVFEPGTADVVPAVAPSGRRSLGFFAR